MNPFTGFFHWLARSGPGVIVAVYAVVILVFAAAYCALPGQFYHPYVTHEPAVFQARDELGRMLEAAIRTSLEQRPDLGQQVQFENVFGSVQISGVQNRALLGSVQVAVSIPFGADSRTLYFLEVPLIISPFGLENDEPNRSANQRIYIKRDPARIVADTSTFAHDPAERATVADAASNAIASVDLDMAQLSETESVLNAELGFPSSVAGTFERMLYFSAITIATVGYGDIVPLTAIARLLAAVEATLGIFLLGVLVNSFGKWLPTDRNRQPPRHNPAAT